MWQYIFIFCLIENRRFKSQILSNMPSSLQRDLTGTLLPVEISYHSLVQDGELQKKSSDLNLISSLHHVKNVSFSGNQCSLDAKVNFGCIRLSRFSFATQCIYKALRQGPKSLGSCLAPRPSASGL